MALILAAAVSLPVLFVETDYVADGYTVDPRTQESSTRLVAYNDISSSAVSDESLYVVTDYYDDGYTIDPRQETSSLNVSGSLIKTADTIVSFTYSSTDLNGARTVSTGFVSDSTGRHILAPWIVVSTGMASSTASEMVMPFGMSIDVAAVNPENPYAVDGYVVDDYYVDPRTGLTSVVVAPNRVREPLMVVDVQSAVDVAVTQVHTTGVQVDGQSSVVGFGARIQSTGALSSAGLPYVDPDTLLPFELLSDPAFGVLVNGRKLGDINNDGFVLSADVLAYFNYANDVEQPQEYVDYIENVMHPYMLANKDDFAPYIAYAVETVIAGSKVMDFGYLTEGQSAVDIGPSLIRTYGALVDGVSTTVIAPNFTGTFGAVSSAQSAVLTGAKVTMVAGALSTAQSSVIISARLKWEAVPEPTNSWTVINDDNYPFG